MRWGLVLGVLGLLTIMTIPTVTALCLGFVATDVYKGEPPVFPSDRIGGQNHWILGAGSGYDSYSFRYSDLGTNTFTGGGVVACLYPCSASAGDLCTITVEWYNWKECSWAGSSGSFPEPGAYIYGTFGGYINQWGYVIFGIEWAARCA